MTTRLHFEDLSADPWAFGPWCFVIADVRILPTPIPCRGMQGWWPMEEEHRDALSAICPLRPYDRVLSAVTLLQPFASAVAYGPKRIENRPVRRRIPPGGVWLGLHAGKALYCSDAIARGTTSRTVQADAFVRRMLTRWSLGAEPPSWPEAPRVEQLPRGCLLGAMHIVDCLPYPRSGGLRG